ncbi:hypothetical protein GCM10010250_36820 [Streptomyces althioticus]|nr:hypothetical protein GCM10010250_36820 [Streptomyces althioticus]
MRAEGAWPTWPAPAGKADPPGRGRANRVSAATAADEAIADAAEASTRPRRA